MSDAMTAYKDELCDALFEDGTPWSQAGDRTPSDEEREQDFFRPSFSEEYALARQIGDERFGSECPHARAHRGRCCKCGRKVM